MIHGSVNHDLEAVVAILVRGPGGIREVEAVIDTGFNGALSLSSDVISDMQLPWRETGWAVLADDSEILVDLYEATVEWHERELQVYVDEGCSVPLVGMSLLQGSLLSVRVVAGGSVNVEELL